MLRWMGAVDENTLVVTTVHDCQVSRTNPGQDPLLLHHYLPFLGMHQVLEEAIEPGRMLEHDVPVDLIVTPTRVGGTTRSRELGPLMQQRLGVPSSGHSHDTPVAQAQRDLVASTEP